MLTRFRHSLALCAWLAWSALAAAGASDSSEHWAFRAPEAVEPPAVRHPRWCRNPIDRFILAEQEKHGLKPHAPAPRRSLIRRAYLDLLGLPPTPAQVERFVLDKRPDAFERLVDELLASPHYGERWGRWWLDLARYADSNGQDENKFMGNAWRYRDWVIRSMNADLPFSDFLTQQIAGDLLPEEGLSQREVFDRWTATGFLVLGPKMLAEQDKPKLVMDLVDEQIDTVSRAFLGLTVSCARCHDHKFDPVSTRDYYALAGIFKSTKTMADLAFVSTWNERPIDTREELQRRQEFMAATNRFQQELSTLLREADAGVAATLRAASKRYAETAWSLTQTSAAPVSTQRLDTVSQSLGLHAGILRRWVSHLERERQRGVLTAAQWNDLTASLPGMAESLVAPDGAAGPAMAWSDGKIGSGFRALGSNYLATPHSAAMEPEQLTLELWVRPDALPQEEEPRRWLASKNGNEWVDGHYGLIVQGSRAGAYLNIGGGASHVWLAMSPEKTIAVNRWTHLAMTYDGKDLRLYCNGEPSTVIAVNQKRTAGQGEFQLGRRVDGYRYFQGTLDEVMLFSQALSADAIRAHFKRSTPYDPALDTLAGAGLVKGWEFIPATDEERRLVSRGELRALFFGEEGLLRPPVGARSLWRAEQRSAVEQAERRLAEQLAHPPAAEARCIAVADGSIVDLPVHVRGSHLNLETNPVPRGFIPVLKTKAARSVVPKQQSGRLELARWLTSPDHPLTARVTMNRVWQAHFGEGLVRSADNFGLRGEKPSHPELLDWLSLELIKQGWSLKRMHRLILNSATYQQGADLQDSRSAEMDPDNRWLSRFPRQRLEGETLRDAMLLISGRLDTTQGGSLVSWKNTEYVPGRDQEPLNSVRRSIYLPVIRDRVYEVFTLFDFANPSLGCSQRKITTVAHQALFFMNSPLVKECARDLAIRVIREGGTSTEGRIADAYQRCLGRKPKEEETRRATRFLEQAAALLGAQATEQVWAAFCQTLFSSSEFVYRE